MRSSSFHRLPCRAEAAVGGLRLRAVEPQLFNKGSKSVFPHIADDAVSGSFGFVGAVGHAAAEAGCFQHPDIVGGVACRHGLGEGEAHLFAKVCEARALVDPTPHDVIEVGAVGQLAAVCMK